MDLPTIVNLLQSVIAKLTEKCTYADQISMKVQAIKNNLFFFCTQQIVF